MKRLIIRFEQSDGCGVYYGGGVANEYVESERHPIPEQDAGLGKWRQEYTAEDRSEWFFGFGTLAQARAWFYDRECLEAMEEEGNRLKVYAVEDDADVVVVGYAQTVFRILKAELVAEFNPTDLHHPQFHDTLHALNEAVNNLPKIQDIIDNIDF